MCRSVLSASGPDSLRNQASQRKFFKPPQASKQLKEEGNRLHSAGAFSDAAAKYERAKTNLEGMGTKDAADLRRACVLNLGSCYLNLQRWDACVQQCDEILKGARHR